MKTFNYCDDHPKQIGWYPFIDVYVTVIFLIIIINHMWYSISFIQHCSGSCSHFFRSR